MVMTSYRPAVFSSTRTAGSIHRPVAIQRSRVARAARALTGWPHLIQPGEEFYSKHWVSRRSFRLLILSLGFLSIPSILSNHLPIAEQAQILSGESAGFSIGDKSQVSFPLVLQLSSHHFRFHDEAIFRGLCGCFWWRLSSQANGNPRGEGGD